MGAALDLPTGRRGRFLAIGLTVAVLGFAWAGVAAPLLAWRTERAERLDRQRALVHRMEALAETLPELRRQAAGADGGARGAGFGSSAVLLPGGGNGGDAVAAATLQGRLQEMAAAAGAVLTSAEALPAESAGPGGLRRIGLRVALVAPWPVLVQLLESISAANAPRMLLDDLQLRAPDLMRQRPVAMEATFIVLAFRADAPAR